ncbi:MAG TPA: DUF6152 family protein [Gammaproteobacteria bacterium]
MKLILSFVAVAFGLLSAHAAFSHHSREAYFHMDTILTLEDVTAVEFRVVNPHSQLVFTMADESGNEVEWEGGILSASHLRRAGVRPDLIQPGDKLTLTASPAKGERNGVWIYKIVLPNGDTADLFDAIRAGTDPIIPASQ